MTFAPARLGQPAEGLRRVALIAPGVGLSLIVAAAALQFASAWHLAPAIAALAGGVSLSFLQTDHRIAPGMTFAARDLLRVGVALAGARVSFEQISALGIGAGMVTLAALIATLVIGFGLGRVVGLSRGQSIITAGAVAICGASAALAFSAALPRNSARERETAIAVALVTLVGSVAMIVYPLFANALQLDDRSTAIFLGATLHELAQAAGAGYAVSSTVGAEAVAIKLLRVACLAPLVLALSLAVSTRAVTLSARPPLVPWFIVGFALTAAAANLGLVPPAGIRAAEAASQWCVLAAVAALGLRISPSMLVSGGVRPLVVVVGASVILAATVLGLLLAWP